VAAIWEFFKGTEWAFFVQVAMPMRLPDAGRLLKNKPSGVGLGYGCQLIAEIGGLFPQSYFGPFDKFTAYEDLYAQIGLTPYADCLDRPPSPSF